MFVLVSGTRVHLRPLWRIYLFSLFTGSLYQLFWLHRTGGDLAVLRRFVARPIAWLVAVAGAELAVLGVAASGVSDVPGWVAMVAAMATCAGAWAIAELATQVRAFQDARTTPSHRVEPAIAAALFLVGLAIGAAAVTPAVDMSAGERIVTAVTGGILLPFWLLYLQHGLNLSLATLEPVSEEEVAYGMLQGGVDHSMIRASLARHQARMQASEQLDVRPWATLGLVAICTAVWIWQMARFGLVLDKQELFASGAVSNERVLAGEWWRLVSQHVTHGSIDHWAFNMFSLVLGGWMVERFLGARAMIGVMVASAVGAAALSWWGLPALFGAAGATVPALGESGIGFGVIGALLGCDPKARGPVGQFGKYMSIFGVVVSLSPGVNMFAHAGGYAGGFLVAFWITRTARAQHEVERIEEARRASVKAQLDRSAVAPVMPPIVAPPVQHLPAVVPPPTLPQVIPPPVRRTPAPLPPPLRDVG